MESNLIDHPRPEGGGPLLYKVPKGHRPSQAPNSVRVTVFGQPPQCAEHQRQRTLLINGLIGNKELGVGEDLAIHRSFGNTDYLFIIARDFHKRQTLLQHVHLNFGSPSFRLTIIRSISTTCSATAATAATSGQYLRGRWRAFVYRR